MNPIDENQPAPLFEINNQNDLDAQIDLNDYYKLSSKRNRRTNYSRNFIDNFTPNPLYDNPKFIKNDSLYVHDRNLKETRTKSWFDEPCNQFNKSDRSIELLKPRNPKNNLDDRYRIMRRSQDFKIQKENNNSSITAIEKLTKRSSDLVQIFKKKYEY
jgi:hypothetical protein